MLDDQCIANGGLWCTAGDPTNRMLLMVMLLLVIVFVVQVVRLVMGRVGKGQTSPSIATKLSDWRKKSEEEDE
jgi:uncharacterized membrane protein affecting hemolysin expression